MANDGYVKKSDVESVLWELRKGYRKTEERCAISGCVLEIRDMPTVDAVEVTRCKNCKQWSRNSGIAESPNGHCFCHDIETNGHDFCSYGEREDNG